MVNNPSVARPPIFHRQRQLADDFTSSIRPGRAARGFSIICIWSGVLVLLLVEVSARDIIDLDVFHEMALFREIIATGSIPRADVFAYTPTVDPVVHHEWGTGAVLYLATVASGWGATGLLMLRYVLVMAITTTCYACARLRGASDLVMALLAPFAIYLLAPSLGPIRAQMFSLLLLAVLLLMFEADRRGVRWWIAIWLPLHVLWLNLHAGVVVGIGLFLLYTMERFARAWRERRSLKQAIDATAHLLAGVVSLGPLMLINPYGREYIPYLWHAIRLERPLIVEWAPLWDPAWRSSYLVIFVMMLVFVLYAVVRSEHVRRAPGLLLVLATAYFALSHMRHTSLFAVAWFCYVPAYLTRSELGDLLRQWFARRPSTVAAALFLFPIALAAQRDTDASFIALRVPVEPTEEGALYYPAGAVQYLSAQAFTGNLMTQFSHGSFVSWKLHPFVKVGMDSRYEVAYPPEAVDDNYRLYAGRPGWRSILEKHPRTDAVLVPRTSPLDSLLSQAPAADRWRRVYMDDGFTIFATGAAGAELDPLIRIGQPIHVRFP